MYNTKHSLTATLDGSNEDEVTLSLKVSWAENWMEEMKESLCETT